MTLVLAAALAFAQEPLEQAWERLERMDAAGYPDIGAAGVLDALALEPRATYWRLRLAEYQGEHGHWRAQDYVLAQDLPADIPRSEWLELARLDWAITRGDVTRALTLLPASDDPLVNDAARLLRAQGRLAQLDAVAAREELRFVVGPLDERARALERDLQEWESLPRRRQGVAGALSIVPGLGQAYAGEPTGGALALALTGGGAYAASSLWASGRRGGAVACGLGAATVWITSGFAATSQARAFTRARRSTRAVELVQSSGIHVEPGTPELLGRVAPGPHRGVGAPE